MAKPIPERQDPLSVTASGSSSSSDVDVAIIGGGVNGAGVARDATLRGLRVALFERNDFAFGASGNSSGLIHGGPRYLSYDVKVTRTSCLDSGHIQAIAPHLLFRIPFLMPIGKAGFGRAMIELVDAFFEAYDFYQPLKHGKPHARLSREELLHLEPGLAGVGPAGEIVGGISFDEWGIDGARLCVANAMDAAERGARVHNHTTVEAILRDPKSGAVRGVRHRDRLTGEGGVTTARAVVNATGAWTAVTMAAGGIEEREPLVRPGKGIHIVFDRRLTNYAIVAKGIDGRQIFIEPWQNVTIVGTTDDDFYGDPDDVRATSDEVRYLVQGTARVFPSIQTARAIGTTAGVRPTLYCYGPNEDELSRDHRIVDHARNGAPGLYSMVGGKLASYRLFAEEMTDVLVARFSLAARPCTTATAFLPGGDANVDSLALSERIGVDAILARRMTYRHGGRAVRIEERIARRPAEAAVVCPCEPVSEAEVRYVVRHEMAMTVDDVSRRTRLGLGACGGMRCAARCGQIVAEERDLDPRDGRQQALRFLVRQARTRAPCMGPEQAAAEALQLASLRSELDRVEVED
jgi:glycerol-3-phosphate dehydrogenase